MKKNLELCLLPDSGKALIGLQGGMQNIKDKSGRDTGKAAFLAEPCQLADYY